MTMSAKREARSISSSRRGILRKGRRVPFGCNLAAKRAAANVAGVALV